jgi:hypothetical protein
VRLSIPEAERDPDRWPVVCWLKGPVRVLERMTITKMILGWLERRPCMRTVWGDVNDLDPARM